VQFNNDFSVAFIHKSIKRKWENFLVVFKREKKINKRVCTQYFPLPSLRYQTVKTEPKWWWPALHCERLETPTYTDFQIEHNNVVGPTRHTAGKKTGEETELPSVW
jgi:hypothetical protein